MQFDIDVNSEFSSIFLRLREILLSYSEINELKNPKQTAYFDEYSSIGFLRANKKFLTFSLANGVRLEEKFGPLDGCGKIVRHIYFYKIEDIDEDYIRAIIEESLILNIEKNAMKILRS